MPELRFDVHSVEAVAGAAIPCLAFKLRVGNTPPQETVESILLRCQLRIDADRRGYDPGQQQRLIELFGEPERWSRTLRPLPWTSLTVVVPRFVGATELDLPVPCSADLEVTVTKLFHGLQGEGELPLTFLFSGTVFYAREAGLQIAPIAWTQEATYRLPVRTWSAMMEASFPGRSVVSLARETALRLDRYRVRQGLMSFDQALDRLLPPEEEALPAIGARRDERPAS